jgi:hypothetical protein
MIFEPLHGYETNTQNCYSPSTLADFIRDFKRAKAGDLVRVEDSIALLN